MASYQMKIAKLRDQLIQISVKIDDEELVQIALNSFSPSWEACVGCLCLITPVDFEKSLEHIRPRRNKAKKHNGINIIIIYPPQCLGMIKVWTMLEPLDSYCVADWCGHLKGIL